MAIISKRAFVVLLDSATILSIICIVIGIIMSNGLVIIGSIMMAFVTKFINVLINE